MTEQEVECIRIRDIRRFVESGLGQRMKKAAMKKHLYREQPFVIQRNASMLDDGWKNETVLVQGIIDAYFMEEEEIVLVDYKTDRVKMCIRDSFCSLLSTGYKVDSETSRTPRTSCVILYP